MEIKLYIQMLQKGWWLIVLTTLVAMISSLTISYFSIPQYQSTARFIITPNASIGSGPDVVDSLDTLDNRSIVTTYAEIMNSQRIRSDAILAMQTQTISFEDYVSLAVVLPDTSVLELNVIGPDPIIAANLANSIGSETINFTERINQVYDLNFLDIAAPLQIPVSPQPLRDLSVALVIGVFGGAILAIFTEQFRIPLETYRQRFRLDKVTGVYNRKYILRLIEEEILRDRSGTFSIGILELGQFRDLLETLSISASQKILLRIIDTLKKEFRGNDIIGRWDDDSFMIIMPATSGDAANRIFERVFQVLPIDLHQFAIDATLHPNIGGAEYSNSITSNELVEKAETALEEARRDTIRPIHVWILKSPFWARDINQK